MRFTGRREVSATDKLRLAIPAKYRAGLAPAAEIMVRPGVSPGWLQLYPSDYFASLSENISKMAPFRTDVEEFRRVFYSSIESVSLDSQGRLALTPELAEHIEFKVGAKLVVLGLGDYLEVWNQNYWQLKQTRLSKDTPDISNRMAYILDTYNQS